MSNDEVLGLASAIVTAMTGNANFTTPNPALAALTTLKTTAQTKINTYNSALIAAQTAMTDRDAAVEALCAGLTQEAAYVENISGGDALKIESAGMGVRAPSTPVGQMTQVLNLVLTAGDFEGTLDAGWDPNYGASGYELQTSADPVTGASWVTKMMATKSSATLGPLTTGNRVWVRARAIGAGNVPGPWSDPAVKTVP